MADFGQTDFGQIDLLCVVCLVWLLVSREGFGLVTRDRPSQDRPSLGRPKFRSGGLVVEFWWCFSLQMCTFERLRPISTSSNFFDF